jgi:hypothetical protein
MTEAPGAFKKHRIGAGADGTEPKTIFLACSALGKEVTAIIRKHGWYADFRPIDSKYHLYPTQIEEQVEQKLCETDGVYERRVVVYGHCGAQNLDRILGEHAGAIRTAGPHCYEMYGGEDFRKSVKEVPGTYFLSDYLVAVWDKLIVKGLKLDKHPKLAKVMFGHYKRMLYYSQEQNPKLAEKAATIADSLGLELVIKHVGYGDLEHRLVAIMNGEPQPGAEAEQADYVYPTAEAAQ